MDPPKNTCQFDSPCACVRAPGRRWSIGAGLALLFFMFPACAHHRSDTALNYRLTNRDPVSGEVADRFGHSLGPASCPDEIIYPNGISLDQELTEDQAVLLALWNNAAFLELLADLGMARGDLVQAGLLPNPEMIYFFPVEGKVFKYLFDFPLESLWLRPIRVAAADRELDRTSQRLTQAAIDLIRDVRQSYADVVLSYERRRIAGEAVQIRNRIAQLADARLDAGDISPQEASTARIDRFRAQQDAARADYDVGLAEERLRLLMGVGGNRTPLKLVASELPTLELPDIQQLVDEAATTRPDVQATAQLAEAAAERLRLARIGWVRLLGILDATSGQANGHGFGPAGRVTLPLFHWNQGNIERAEAELEKAERQRMTVLNQVIWDVRQAHLRWEQGQAELKIVTGQVRPEAEVAIRRTEVAYQAGNTPYVVVLQTTQQLLDSRFREAQLHADLRRAWAELERSVGQHLGDDWQSAQVAPTPTDDAPAANLTATTRTNEAASDTESGRP